MSDPIRKFKGAIYKKRWGTVAFSAPELIKVRRPLQHAWDPNRYIGKELKASEDVQADGYVPEGTFITAVDIEIRSVYFWNYWIMLEFLSTFMRRLVEWVVWCPCHYPLIRQWGDDIPFFRRRVWERCVMRGSRCAEL